MNHGPFRLCFGSAWLIDSLPGPLCRLYLLLWGVDWFTIFSALRSWFIYHLLWPIDWFIICSVPLINLLSAPNHWLIYHLTLYWICSALRLGAIIFCSGCPGRYLSSTLGFTSLCSETLTVLMLLWDPLIRVIQNTFYCVSTTPRSLGRIIYDLFSLHLIDFTRGCQEIFNQKIVDDIYLVFIQCPESKTIPVHAKPIQGYPSLYQVISAQPC